MGQKLKMCDSYRILPYQFNSDTEVCCYIIHYYITILFSIVDIDTICANIGFLNVIVILE